MGRTKKPEEEELEIQETASEVIVEKTEKEKLYELYEEMKSRNIRSISDIENQIARLS